MKYDDIRNQIQTGDLLLCDGNGIVSEIIESATEGRFSHVAVFFWLGEGLFIAEEWQGVGFQIMPASQKISMVDGKCYWGVAPAVVRENPFGVTDCIDTYRVTPKLQPYGYGTLAEVLLAHQLGVDISPDSVQAVCSVFAQQCWERCGYVFETLADPSDFDALCAGVTIIE